MDQSDFELRRELAESEKSVTLIRLDEDTDADRTTEARRVHHQPAKSAFALPLDLSQVTGAHSPPPKQPQVHKAKSGTTPEHRRNLTARSARSMLLLWQPQSTELKRSAKKKDQQSEARSPVQLTSSDDSDDVNRVGASNRSDSREDESEFINVEEASRLFFNKFFASVFEENQQQVDPDGNSYITRVQFEMAVRTIQPPEDVDQEQLDDQINHMLTLQDKADPLQQDRISRQSLLRAIREDMEVQMSTSSLNDSPARLHSPSNLALQQHQSETVHLRQGSLAVTEMTSPDGKYFSNTNSQVTEVEMFNSASKVRL